MPGVFFHGKNDNLLPYKTGHHHCCDRNKADYIRLDGSKPITEKLDDLNSSYLLHSFKGGKKEHSGIAFDYLPEVFSSFNSVFLND
ncbi:hypothetical protein [Gillisia limnaea]|uniref:hypothetical protein n=1 Tax=Gillisia limnaea TaxID=195907 RepID=UPI00030944AB|nr:hypothetical protein [Gillisia limnaea]